MARRRSDDRRAESFEEMVELSCCWKLPGTERNNIGVKRTVLTTAGEVPEEEPSSYRASSPLVSLPVQQLCHHVRMTRAILAASE
mmetsp:Transcript_22440/g.38019  ORF Transcript_22440/g.38019 Transcript_22440/m.38019 type:complete len:85 (-) Transcript_22440:113-367(-)